VTSDYVIDQAMITIYDIKKMLGGEAKHNPRNFTILENRCSNIIHLWSLLTLNQISILIFLKL